MASGLSSNVRGWSTAEVEVFIRSLGLDAVAQTFRDNAVNGEDLLDLEDDDLEELPGLTKIQMRKIRKGLKDIQDTTGLSAQMHGASLSDPALAGYGAAGGGQNAPHDAAAQQKQDEINGQKAMVGGAINALDAAAGSLGKANELLGQAAGALQKASGLAGAEMLGDVMRPGIGGRRAFGIGKPPMERMANMGEMGMVNKAGEATKAAVALVERAYSMGIQGLPNIDLARVKKLSMVSMWAFDGMLGDMAHRRKIQDNLAQVHDMQRDVARSLQWVTGELSRKRSDMARLDGMAAAYGAGANLAPQAYPAAAGYAPAPAAYSAPAPTAYPPQPYPAYTAPPAYSDPAGYGAPSAYPPAQTSSQLNYSDASSSGQRTGGGGGMLLAGMAVGAAVARPGGVGGVGHVGRVGGIGRRF